MNPDSSFWKECEGEKIADSYKLEGLLGCGNFGGVFRSVQIVNGEELPEKKVAVKLMASGQISLDELRFALRLPNHPNLVHHYTGNSVQIRGFSMFYLVMELASGSLADFVRQKGGRVSSDQAKPIVRDIAQGLKFLHELDSGDTKYVHRDLKLLNVLQVGENWKIADFGLAKALDKGTMDASKIAGTPYYMPPELFGNSNVSVKWDIWSLGVMIVEMLTGHFPFEEATQEQLMGAILKKNPNLRGVPLEWKAIVEGCLVKDHDRRWTAAQVLEAVKKIGSDQVDSGTKQPKGASQRDRSVIQPTVYAGDRTGGSKKFSRRTFLFLGLGAAAFGSTVAVRSWLKSVTPIPVTPITDRPNAGSCGNLDNPIVYPDLVAGLPTETHSFSTVINLNSAGTGGQELNRQVTRWIEDLGDGVLLHLVRIPAGTFTMGSPEGEIDRSDDESPQHEVSIPECWMGQFEITQAQYQRVTNQNPATGSDDKFVDPQKPIINVSWEDAVAFCKALSDRTGRTYRLPTEAEREYACRACTTTPFHFGESITPDVVNYDGNYPYANAAKGEHRQQTTPVGSFPPNPWGLYDMHGNVWEWCADQWYNSYNDKPDELKQDGSIAWTQNNTNVLPSESGDHLLRGGSWYSLARDTRSADRGRRLIRYYDNGFRVLLSSRIP